LDDGVINIFRKLYKGAGNLRLLNVFQGIPIAYPGTIVSVGDDSVIVRTEKYQMVCLYRERETYIHNSEFRSVVKARVSDLYISQLQVTLTDFEYVDKGIGDRRQVRVWPREILTGGLQLTDRTEAVSGELADISLDGVGIFVPEKDFSPRVFRHGRKIAVNYRLMGTFQLPQAKRYEVQASSDPTLRFDRSQLRLSSIHTPDTGGEQGGSTRLVYSPDLETQGIVANISYDAANMRYRLGVQLLPDEQYRAIVSQFVSQRQSELIQEITSLYKLLSKEA
jgi:hypothetical protein